MDTIVRPPEAPPEPHGPSPDRRWPRVLVVALLVLLVASAVLTSAWVANYHPFVPGSRGWHPQDERIRVTDIDAMGASGRLFELPVSGRTLFRYTFSITNAGPFPVTIEGVGPPVAEQTGRVARRPVRLVEDEAAQGSGPLILEPWHPFVLRPGQQANIEMEVTFRPELCLDRGTRLSWWPEVIRFTVFGVPRTATFESDLEVRIVGTEDC